MALFGPVFAMNPALDPADPSPPARFVFNLTPRWLADWGGQLQFIGPDGHVTEVYVPRHSVIGWLLAN